VQVLNVQQFDCAERIVLMNEISAGEDANEGCIGVALGDAEDPCRCSTCNNLIVWRVLA